MSSECGVTGYECMHSCPFFKWKNQTSSSEVDRTKMKKDGKKKTRNKKK